MRLRDRPIAEWPPLAWLARCRPGETTIDVFHGRRVEIAADWLCEAAWNGSFADGDFDRTDLVFGSGVRVRGDRVCFVSSGSYQPDTPSRSRSSSVCVWCSNAINSAVVMYLAGASAGPSIPPMPVIFRT